MEDEDAAGEGNEDIQAEATNQPTPEHPQVAMEYVDSLPHGRVVMPVEREGSFTWLIVRGHISPQARTEMLANLRHIVGSGLWRQDWQPPQTG